MLLKYPFPPLSPGEKKGMEPHRQQLLLAPLPHNPSPLLRALHTVGIGTSILLVTQVPPTRAQVATLQEIQAYTITVLGSQPELVAIPPEDPPTAVKEILDKLTAYRPARIRADLSAADPYTTTVATIALILYTTKTGTRTEITLTQSPKPTPLQAQTVPPIIARTLTKTQEKIVEKLATQGPQTIEQLATQLQLSPTTIQKHIKILKAKNLVTQRQRKITPTPWLHIYYKTHLQP